MYLALGAVEVEMEIFRKLRAFHNIVQGQRAKEWFRLQWDDKQIVNEFKDVARLVDADVARQMIAFRK